MRKVIISNELFFAEIEQLISDGNDAEIWLKGNSMRPFIRSDRTRIRLSPCDTDQLQPGEVVLFRYKGRHLLHRIASRNGNEFVLAGDGNCGIREYCTASDIVARMTAIVTKRGRVIDSGSRLWRTVSAIWVALPKFVKRCILGALWRMGVR